MLNLANPHPSILNPRTAVSQAPQVSLPYNFTPRHYQNEDLFRPLFPHHYADLRAQGVQPKKRIVSVWHRRAGKDKCFINAITLAAWEKVGNYLYLLPEQTQAKKVVWRGIGKDGFRFLDHIPKQIIKNSYASELLIELINGSTIQVGGSDKYDSWMGTNPIGIVFSEFSLQDPLAWEYFRPILAENDGWAAFIYTARGKNHGYKLYQDALKNPDTWHCSLKTIEDTFQEDGTPVISQETYLKELKNGMMEALARQEFYCDFNAQLLGSYYGDLMAKARAEGRVGFFPHDPKKKVYTAWDIGLDATAVWFAQKEGSGLQLIDHFEESNTRFTDCVREVLNKPYKFGAHFGPHDLKNRNPEMETRIETAADLGLDFVVTPRLSLADGIEAVRSLLPRCRFNAETCGRGLDSLVSYERVYDLKLARFRDQPVHNWACLPVGTKINTPYGPKAVETFSPGDEVSVAGVNAKVVRAQSVGKQRIVLINASNCVSIRCSEGHKFFTGRGMVKAKDLLPGDELLTDVEVKRWSADKRGIQEAFIASFKGSSTVTGRIEGSIAARPVGDSGCFIEMSMSAVLGLLGRATQWFLSQVIGMTSHPKIGFVGLALKTGELLKLNTPDRSSTESFSGRYRKQGITAARKTAPRSICTGTSGSISMEKSPVAGSFITLTTTGLITKLKILFSSLIKSTADTTQDIIRGVGVKRTRNNFEKPGKSRRVLNVTKQGLEEVFDIEVEKHHAYTLTESGVVTSNSHAADAFRILALNWQDGIEQEDWNSKPIKVDVKWVV